MVHATVPEAPRSLPVSSFPAPWELPRSWAHLIRFGPSLRTSQSVPRKYSSVFGTTITDRPRRDAPLRTWRDKIATEICRQPFGAIMISIVHGANYYYYAEYAASHLGTLSEQLLKPTVPPFPPHARV